jgi:hypothetical protein
VSASYPDLEDWLAWVFAGARLGDPRDPEVDELVYAVPNEIALGYFTEACGRSSALLASFSDAELCGGLWFLLSSSDVLTLSLQPEVKEPELIAFLHATEALFRDLFAIRCTSALSHRDEEASPLNSPCYMWWDLAPFSPRGPWRLVDACLDVMESTLALDNDACRESALHGLGHFRSDAWPERRRRAIVERFLAEHGPGLRPQLAAYARAALAGCVQ